MNKTDKFTITAITIYLFFGCFIGLNAFDISKIAATIMLIFWFSPIVLLVPEYRNATPKNAEEIKRIQQQRRNLAAITYACDCNKCETYEANKVNEIQKEIVGINWAIVIIMCIFLTVITGLTIYRILG